MSLSVVFLRQSALHALGVVQCVCTLLALWLILLLAAYSLPSCFMCCHSLPPVVAPHRQGLYRDSTTLHSHHHQRLSTLQRFMEGKKSMSKTGEHGAHRGHPPAHGRGHDLPVAEGDGAMMWEAPAPMTPAGTVGPELWESGARKIRLRRGRRGGRHRNVTGQEVEPSAARLLQLQQMFGILDRGAPHTREPKLDPSSLPIGHSFAEPGSTSLVPLVSPQCHALCGRLSASYQRPSSSTHNLLLPSMSLGSGPESAGTPFVELTRSLSPAPHPMAASSSGAFISGSTFPGGAPSQSTSSLRLHQDVSSSTGGARSALGSDRSHSNSSHFSASHTMEQQQQQQQHQHHHPHHHHHPYQASSTGSFSVSQSSSSSGLSAISSGQGMSSINLSSCLSVQHQLSHASPSFLSLHHPGDRDRDMALTPLPQGLLLNGPGRDTPLWGWCGNAGPEEDPIIMVDSNLSQQYVPLEHFPTPFMPLRFPESYFWGPGEPGCADTSSSGASGPSKGTFHGHLMGLDEYGRLGRGRTGGSTDHVTALDVDEDVGRGVVVGRSGSPVVDSDDFDESQPMSFDVADATSSNLLGSTGGGPLHPLLHSMASSVDRDNPDAFLASPPANLRQNSSTLTSSTTPFLLPAIRKRSFFSMLLDEPYTPSVQHSAHQPGAIFFLCEIV